MKEKQVSNSILLAKPNVVFLTGFLIVAITGFLGEVFNWNKLLFSPYSNIAGGIIVLCGWLLHLYCHRLHKQAHMKSEKIDKIVTDGLFSKIRHPMYLGLIIMYIGVPASWGVVWMFIPAVLFIGLVVVVAVKEEEYLLSKFGFQYKEYMRKVPWRFIKNIF
jgi:protein-S-isoprenylcysteine O-methyltransferase Ste14